MSRHLALMVDDDDLNNFICKKLFQITYPEVELMTFNEAEAAMAHLKMLNAIDQWPDLIFLDMNMPHVNGWEFLERFSNLQSEHKEKSKIFMLSASVTEDSIERSDEHPLITGCISKPLQKEDLDKIMEIYINEDCV
ncbi:MAG: response regulator [Bacteroidota bacterium]